MGQERPDRTRLIKLYWGNRALPGEWKSEEQIAGILKLDTAEVKELLERYKIRKRGPWGRAHLIIWSILVDEWNMTYGEDFSYRVKVGSRKYDFYIPEEDIMININLQSHGPPRLDCHHGTQTVFVLTVSNDEDGLKGLGEQIIEILRQYEVRRRVVQVVTDDRGVW